MNNIKTNVLFYLLIGLFFLVNVCVWNISLPEVLAHIEQLYAVPKHKFSVLVQFVNEVTWLKFKVALLLVSVLLGGIYFYRGHIFKQFYVSFKYCIGLLREDFGRLKKFEKVFLLSFLFFFGVYLFWLSSEIYFQLDELNSWLYFVDRGILVTASYYPSNNNHIGYNAISVFWNLFLEPSLAMRITSILSSLGVVAVLYLMLVRRYNFLSACVGLLLVASFSCYTWYSIQGRGYMLEMLLLILIFYFILKAKDRNVDNTLVVLSSYSLWILPVAIIPLFVLGVVSFFIIRHDQFVFRRLSIVFLSVSSIAILLYLPVFIFSDISVLYANPFVKHVSYTDAPRVLMSEYLPALGMFLFGVEGLYVLFITVSIISIALWMLVCRSYVIWYYIFIVLFLPALLFLFYPVFLFERIWLWLTIPLLFGVLEIFGFIMVQGNKFVIICVMFFLVTGSICANFNQIQQARKDLKERAFQLEELRQCSSKNGVNTIRIDSDILYTYFRYYQKTSNFQILYGVENAQPKEYILLAPYESPPLGGILIKGNAIGKLYKLQ